MYTDIFIFFYNDPPNKVIICTDTRYWCKGCSLFYNSTINFTARNDIKLQTYWKLSNYELLQASSSAFCSVKKNLWYATVGWLWVSYWKTFRPIVLKLWLDSCFGKCQRKSQICPWLTEKNSAVSSVYVCLIRASVAELSQPHIFSAGGWVTQRKQCLSMSNCCFSSSLTTHAEKAAPAQKSHAQRARGVMI